MHINSSFRRICTCFFHLKSIYYTTISHFMSHISRETGIFFVYYPFRLTVKYPHFDTKVSANNTNKAFSELFLNYIVPGNADQKRPVNSEKQKINGHSHTNTGVWVPVKGKGVERMSQKLWSRILEILRRKLRTKRWQRALTCFAAIAVFGVTYALILPAITMTAGHPKLKAEITSAWVGDELEVTVSADAGNRDEETVFALMFEGEGAELSSSFDFDEEGCCTVTDLSGRDIVLHRMDKETDGTDAGCWFALEKDETTEFTLSFEDKADVSLVLEKSLEITREKLEKATASEAAREGLTATASDALHKDVTATVSNADAVNKATTANAGRHSAATVSNSDIDEETGELKDGMILNDLQEDDEEAASVEAARLKVSAGAGESTAAAALDAVRNADKRGDAQVILSWKMATDSAYRKSWKDDDCVITLVYDEDAEITDRAEFSALKTPEEDELFAERSKESIRAINAGDSQQTGVVSAKFYDLMLDGDPLDTKAPVNLILSYAENITVKPGESLHTVLFDGDQAKEVPATAGLSGNGNITETHGADESDTIHLIQEGSASAVGVVVTSIAGGELKAETDEVSVTVKYQANAGIPVDAALAVNTVPDDLEKYRELEEKIKTALADSDKKFIAGARWIDISAMSGEEEILLNAPVDITVAWRTPMPVREGDVLRAFRVGEKAAEIFDFTSISEDNAVREIHFTSDVLGKYALIDAAAGVSFAEPYECSVPSEVLDEMDFSSRRLLVSVKDAAEISGNTTILGNWQGIYLLQFETEEETRNAFTYYVDRCEFAEPDIAMMAAGILSDGDVENDTGVIEAPVEKMVDGNDFPEGDEDGAEEIAEYPDAEVYVVEDAEENVETEEEQPERITPVEFSEKENPITRLSEELKPSDGITPEALVRMFSSPKIALIDTGVNDSRAEAYSVIGSETKDDNGHGTKMLDIVLRENPKAKIISIKAMDESGRGQLSAIYSAVALAIEKKADIINLSLSAFSTSENSALKEIIETALDQGIVVVAAAGNSGKDASLYIPGNIYGVTTIGSVDEEGNLKSSSNYGDVVDYYVTEESTSSAAARFSGIISTSKSFPDYMDVVKPYLDEQRVIFDAAAYEFGYDETKDETAQNGIFEIDDASHTSVTVTKKWDAKGNTSIKQPDSVKVYLLRNGSKMSGAGYTVTLNAANKWTYTWKDLPKFNGSTAYIYTVEEEELAEWTGTVKEERVQVDGAKVTYKNLNGTVGNAVLMGGTSGRADDNLGTFMNGMPLETITLNVRRLSTTNSALTNNKDYFLLDNKDSSGKVIWGFDPSAPWNVSSSSPFYAHRGYVCYLGGNVPVTKGNDTFKPTKRDFKIRFKNAATGRDGTLYDVVIAYSNIYFRNVDIGDHKAKALKYHPALFTGRHLVSRPKNMVYDSKKKAFTGEDSYINFAMSANVNVYLLLPNEADSTNPANSKVGNNETYLFSILDLDVADQNGGGSQGRDKKTGKNIGGPYRESVWDITNTKSAAYVPASGYGKSITTCWDETSGRKKYTNSEGKTAYYITPFRKIDIQLGSGGTKNGTPEHYNFVALYNDSTYTSKVADHTAQGSYDSGFAVLADAKKGIKFRWTGSGRNMGSTMFAGTSRDTAQVFSITNTPKQVLRLAKRVRPAAADTDKKAEFTFKLFFSEDGTADNYVNLPVQWAAANGFAYDGSDHSYTVKLKDGEYKDIPLLTGTHYTITEVGDSNSNYTAEWISKSGKVDPASISLDEKGTAAWTLNNATFNQDTTVAFLNEMKSPVLKLLKVSAADGRTPVPGVKFTLYADEQLSKVVTNLDGKLLENIVTDAAGSADFGKLNYGTYYLKETETVEGYEPLKSAVKVVLKYGKADYYQDDNSMSMSKGGNGSGSIASQDLMTYTITVTNPPSGTSLPNTGGRGTVLYTLSGMLVLGTALLYGFSMRRGERGLR